MPRKSVANRYVAFLRGINVGGHRVKMDDLAKLFTALKFTNVSTFIASGNVIFDSSTSDTPRLEKQIEDHLERSLGYGAATFVRTPAEIASAIAANPFGSADNPDANHTVHIGFLRESLGKEAKRKLISLGGPMDEFEVIGRELYWLCRGRTSDSPVGWPVVAKTVAMPSTMRNLTMLRKLAVAHPSS
jgi:uncharacterized protein (DUF1697 family)